MGIWYTTRESVKGLLDIKLTARNNDAVDRAIESASRSVEGLLHRRFYPEIATKYFDYPGPAVRRPWRLWLDEHEVLSVSSLVTGGVTVSSSDYFLEPANDPPYDRVEIDLDSSASFESGNTHQRSVAITGTWGYSDVTTPAGSLGEDLDASETLVDVSDSTIGVGDLIKVNSERMVVTDKRMLDTTVDTGGALTANKNDVTVAVADGTAFNVNEVILVDAERMLIVDIAGNNLIVKRAWDGSVLAAHDSGADIYAPRTLVVERGSLGTTAATHSTSDAITKQAYPGPVVTLTEAYALNTLLQGQSGYARTAGEGESAREMTGRGIKAAEKDAMRSYGRMMRTEAV